MNTRWIFPFALAAAVGCGSPTPTPPPPDDVMDSTTGPEVGTDATQGPEVGMDARTETGTETGTDAAPEVGPDADTEAGTDAAMEAAAETGTDAAMEAATEAGADAAMEAGADATPDVAADRPAEAAVLDMCRDPVAMITMPGAAYTRDGMTSGTSLIPRTSCQSLASGPEEFYSLNVTTRTVLNIDTEAARTLSMFDTILSLRRSCGDIATEVACDDDAGRDNTSRIRYLAEPGIYSLIVDGYLSNMGPYGLAVRSAPPAANGACATPLTLTVGGMLAAQDTAGASVVNTQCTAGDGAQLFYQIVVPAMSAVNVTATPAAMSTLRPVIRAKDSCMLTTCAATGLATATGSPGSASLINTGPTPKTYVFSVGDLGTADGVFALTASAATALATNSVCMTPTTLAPGATLSAQNTAAGGSGTTECMSSPGSQLYYQVTVPAMSSVNVRANPTGTPTWAPLLRVRDMCTATTCVTTNTASAAGMSAVVNLVNSAATPRTFIVSAAGSTSQGGTFDLVAAAPTSIAPGSSCDLPIALTSLVPAMGASAATGSSATPNRCQSSVTGPQTYFTATIPPRQRATFRATPMGTWAPTIRVLTSCTATTCLDSRVGATSTPTVFAFDNASAFPQSVVVSVAGASPAAVGTFDMSLTLADITPAAQYTLAMIPGACDTLVAPTTLMPATGAWSDDSTSPVAELPFTVQLNGTAVSHFSANSNGLLQLHTSMAGATSTAFSNATIPTAATPNNFVAPFWDDLSIPPSPAAATIRTSTLGTAPNRRFTVQWTDWRLISDTTSRLAFQVKLFETTNVVELHYCSMTAAASDVARAAGDSATIGIENGAGDNGFLVALNRAATVSTANAFRLTPR
jgi:hypothetical protein